MVKIQLDLFNGTVKNINCPICDNPIYEKDVETDDYENEIFNCTHCGYELKFNADLMYGMFFIEETE